MIDTGNQNPRQMPELDQYLTLQTQTFFLYSRFSSTALTTAATLPRPLTMLKSHADEPPISRTGMPSSSRSTKRCSSRSSWQQTTSISSPSSTSAARLCKFWLFHDPLPEATSSSTQVAIPTIEADTSTLVPFCLVQSSAQT